MTTITTTRPKVIVALALVFTLGTVIGIAVSSELRSADPTLERLQERIPERRPPREPVIFSGFTKSKLAALTFDDGPDPRFTPKVLRILKRNRVKATFFVVGASAKAYPSLVRREAREGHIIENHTWDHPDFELLTDSQMKTELRKTSRIINKLTGKRPRYFRPPHGVLTGAVYWVAANAGYRLVLWSNELREHRFKRPAEDATFVARLVGPGAIILAHDGRHDHTRGVQALPTLIKTLRARGYRFVTVNKLPFPRLKAD